MNNEQQDKAPPALGVATGYAMFEPGVPNFFFQCTHGVFVRNGYTSLCYTTTEERAQWIAQQLTTLAKIKSVAETTWDASDQMDAIDEILSAPNVASEPRPPGNNVKTT